MNALRISGLLFSALLLPPVAGAALAPKPEAPPRDITEQNAFFEARVRPLLHERCLGCHGEKVQQGGLRLDSRAALLQGGKSGPALVPGAPEKSLLLRTVRHDGPVKMPPAGKLPAAEIAALEQWVRQGAVWPEARPKTPPRGAGVPWAFQSVRKPSPPPVRGNWWLKSDIDAFILRKLEDRKLRPTPYASRRTLIRRAYFQLTGLPPKPEEVEAFVNDRRPDAWAKVVDRLLASPQFGEHWGRHWLDVVRYTDSFDSRLLGENNAGRIMDITEAWRYRDWVVQAFNRDLPYNDFVRYQVAGDLLPPLPPAGDPKGKPVPGVLGTGMLAIGSWGGGDADKEKLLTDIADDQIDVVSRAFMGLTVACARCHDHKFDPISTRDYYALAGIFFSSHILENVGPKTNGPPMLRIPLATPEELEARRKHAERLAATEKQLAEAKTAAYTAHARAMLPETSKYLLGAWEYATQPRDGSALPLSQFAQRRELHEYALRQWLDYLGMGEYRLMTTPVRNVLGAAGVFAFKGGADTPSITVNSTDQERALLSFKLAPRSVSLHPGPQNGVVLSWRSPIRGSVRVTGAVRDADPASGDGIAWVVDHRSGVATVELASGEIPNGGRQSLAEGKGAADLASVAVQPADELQLLVLPKNGHGWDTTTVQFVISEVNGERTWDVTRDVVPDLLRDGRGNPHPDRFGNGDVWRFYDMAASGRAGLGPVDPGVRAWQQALRGGAQSPQALQQATQEFARTFTVTDAKSPFWLQSEADEGVLPAADRQKLTALRTAAQKLRETPLPPLEYANGAQEGGVPGSPKQGFADTQVHVRGRYDRLGDTVPRGVPAILVRGEPLTIKQGSGRKELADWLVDPRHPLTARVMANRVWQWLFGEGLVRSANNFGALGEPPTHPELLDYLAATFVEDEWSVKRLIRRIMLSATYQQDSRPRSETLQADPDNRLFSRMNRQRLTAEALRDSLLSVAGSLDLTPGGPATREIESPRRTLYLMTVRSNKEGFRFLFDAANPDSSVEHRITSTVAPQALFLLNHPFALAQARKLAQNLLQASDADDRAGVVRAYGLLFGRPPSADEERVALAFLQGARNGGTEAEGRARAWEEFSQLLLCTNEFIYVD